jgi:hypothetical protein
MCRLSFFSQNPISTAYILLISYLVTHFPLSYQLYNTAAQQISYLLFFIFPYCTMQFPHDGKLSSISISYPSSIIYRIQPFKYRNKKNWIIYGEKVEFEVYNLTLKAYVEYFDANAPSMLRSQHIHCCILPL